jgi:hypothetical protein
VDEVYSSASQKIVHHPVARIVNPRVAIVEYTSEDAELYYSCTHLFQLQTTARINYRSTIDVYERNSQKLVGIVTQRATLKRLLTTHQQLLFARPSLSLIPRAEVQARQRFEH